MCRFFDAGENFFLVRQGSTSFDEFYVGMTFRDLQGGNLVIETGSTLPYFDGSAGRGLTGTGALQGHGEVLCWAFPPWIHGYKPSRWVRL